MGKIKVLFPFICLLIISNSLLSQTQTSRTQTILTTAEAAQHIGETVTVCGLVVDTRYASSSRGRPTFLNLDKPYPKQVFTVVIWGEDRDKFGEPEEKYRDKHICVTGKIRSYRGVPQIQVTDPKQIEVKEEQQTIESVSKSR